MHLRCEGIEKSYGGKKVLKGINLEARPGEITVLIGPNGAGKSTLLKLIALLERPDSGRLLFDQTEVDGAVASMRRSVAMVFQNPLLLDRSVEANLAYGLKRRKVGNIRTRVKALSELLGIGHLDSKNARTLSGGEKRRTAIGMALAVDSPLLLLDECFANLDPLSARVLEDLLVSFRKSGEKTVILATHSLSRAQAYGDTLYFLNEGRIVQKGRPEDIFRKPSSLFAARYLGYRNIFRGSVRKENSQPYVDLDNGVRFAVATELTGTVYATISPTDILVSLTQLHSSALNAFRGVITDTALDGVIANLTVDAGIPIEVVVTKRSLEDLGLKEGKSIFLTWKASAVHVFKELDHA